MFGHPDADPKFQSTRPRGARPCWRTCASWSSSFNPRARVGRDDAMPPDPASLRMFQSTRPRGARRIDLEEEARQAYVSIHAPAWGATTVGSSAIEPTGVSIHAPAWGATAGRCGGSAAYVVSIHAPAWGATLGEIDAAKDGAGFQSTRPRGARLLATPAAEPPCLVSIHAPAWGATHLRSGFAVRMTVSIHAPAWGATRIRGSVRV